MQNALACADRIFDLLEQKEETPDADLVASITKKVMDQLGLN